MKYSQIITHFNPDEAAEIINLLDQLRDVLWKNYREEIEALQKKSQHHHTNAAQHNLDLDDPILF